MNCLPAGQRFARSLEEIALFEGRNLPGLTGRRLLPIEKLKVSPP